MTEVLIFLTWVVCLVCIHGHGQDDRTHPFVPVAENGDQTNYFAKTNEAFPMKEEHPSLTLQGRIHTQKVGEVASKYLRRAQQQLLDDLESCATSFQCNSGCCTYADSNGGQPICISLNGGDASCDCIGLCVDSPTATSTSFAFGPCGNGVLGNGICLDGTCCSEYGYCGTTAEHCSVTTRPSPTSVPVSVVPCGNGIYGNGLCDNDLCCSIFGYCGRTAEYCDHPSSASSPDIVRPAPDNSSTLVVGLSVSSVLLILVCGWYKPWRMCATTPTPMHPIHRASDVAESPRRNTESQPHARNPFSSNNFIPGSRINMESDSDNNGTGDLFDARYAIPAGALLGRGGQGIVYKCTEKSSGKCFAVKIIDTNGKGERAKEPLKREADILKRLQGAPHIIQFYRLIDEPEKIYMVMELLSGGDLAEQIRSRKLSVSERNAQIICRGLIKAISFCHERRIAHRDIKLDNLLVPRMNDYASIKIADFGLAKIVPDQGLLTRCGTPNYLPPEIILRGSLLCRSYDYQCDMWSMGIVVYFLLMGDFPFEAESGKDLCERIVVRELNFDESNPKWERISEHGKSLIRNLLEKNPKKRWSAEDVEKSPWIGALDQDLSDIPIEISVQYFDQHAQSQNPEMSERFINDYNSSSLTTSNALSV